MSEESPEGFIARWRQHAATVELFAHTEGSPLLEGRVGDTVLQLFERTGPYLSRPGPTQMIINPTTSSLEVVHDPDVVAHLECHGLGKLTAVGRLVAREGDMAVVDAGAPLVVSLTAPLDRAPLDRSPFDQAHDSALGGMVRFESEGPIHGFVMTGNRPQQRRAEADDDSI